MVIRRTVRSLTIVLLAIFAGLSLVGPASAHSDRSDHAALQDRIELPDGFQPEGIAIGRDATAYFGSLANGDIYAASLSTGKGKVISKGPGTPSVGIKLDRQNRLFVAGGPAGNGRVVDVKSGRILATYQFTTGASFVNDVVLTRSFAWFTDSFNAQLYGVPLGQKGLPAASAVVTLPLRGAWVQTPGVINANGIAATPDRRALLVVQSNTGFLFRVDPRTGVASRVDLGATLLTAGDGLLVKGHTLYAVQNQLNQVAVVKLDDSGTRGRLTSTLTSPDLDVPTTIAAFGHSLYLPNARFGVAGPATAKYWATRIDRR